MRRKCIVLMLCISMIFGQIAFVQAEPVIDLDLDEIQTTSGLGVQEETEHQEYKEDEVIIVYENEMADVDKVEQAIENNSTRSLDETEKALADLGIAEQEEILTSENSVNGAVAVAALPEETSVNEAIRTLEETENVAYVQRNYVYSLQETDINDSEQENAYHLDNLNLYDAWDSVRADDSSYNKSGTPVTVAVLDTGINYDKSERHEELQDVSDGGNIWYTYAYDAYQGEMMSEAGTDWYDSTGTYTDYDGHGTTVASLIAASANNGVGTAGVSYNGRVLPISVFEKPGPEEVNRKYDHLYKFNADASTRTLIAAYNYVLENAEQLNIKVINMSLGGNSEKIDKILQDSIQKAYEAGILTVAAAGNYENVNEIEEDKDKTMYPAASEHVLSVASVDCDNDHSYFSCHNDAVDISASGSSILTPAAGYEYSMKKNKLYWYKTDGYTNYRVNGTSFASPIVAGIAALLYAADPDMTPDLAETYLTGTATDVGEEGRDNYYGYGIVDAYEAVQAALGNEVSSSVLSTPSSSIEEVTAAPTLARLISSMKLSVTKFVYDGEVKQPSATVTYAGRTIADKISSSTDSIKLTYGGSRIKVGTYRVRAAGQSFFTSVVDEEDPDEETWEGTTFNGSIVTTFKIIPKSTKITSLARKKKGFTATWKKHKAQTDGYQIRYATKSNMSDAKVTTIRGYASTSKTISGLKAEKRYYVQIRAYKKVDGKNYFSNWSDTQKIKTK